MDAPEDDERKRALLEKHVRDGSISLSGKPVERSKTGVWKAAPFIYVLIFADTVSVLGIAGNLVTYAFGTLHLGIAESANTVTNFMGLTYLLPIIWGFLADSYFGRFWVIAFASITTLTGLVLLTLSTSLPSLKPPSCKPINETAMCPKASAYVLTWFYAALYLVSVGSAGLKPCMLSMGQDQFDDTDPQEKKQGSKFFTVYYIFLNLYSIFCVTVLFYIQSSVGFSWGYGCIAGIYVVGISIFFLGTPFYRHRKPAGSTLTRAAQVFVAAIKKVNKPLPADAQELHELDDNKAKAEGIRKIVHTQKLRCLDKAAIVTPVEHHQQTPPDSKWELCTITQVEELKSVIQIVPIWLCLILVFTLYAQVMGVGVQQATTLDRRLGPHFTMPPGSAAISLMLSGIFFIFIYEYFLVPPLRKITGHPQGLSPLRKIGVALVLSILAMVVAANVEGKRVRTLEEYSVPNAIRQVSEVEVPMSVWWLLPQFALLGWVEVLLGVAQLHLLYQEMPGSMRNLAVSLTFTTISIGYFVSTGLVNIVNKYSASTGGWLADEFNTGGLRKYYYLLAVIMSVNLLIFVALSHGYTYKKLEPAPSESVHPGIMSRTPLTTVSEGEP